MQAENGIKIANVHPDSPAEKSGILPGDILLSINSHKLRDPIDFIFYSADDSLDIEVKRSGKNINIRTDRKRGRRIRRGF